MSFSKNIIDRFLFWSLFIIGLPVTIYTSTGPWPEDKSLQQVTPSQEIIGQDEISIAVFDIKGIGISKIAVKTLSDHLRTELERTCIVTPVGPAKIREILEQKGVQETETSSVDWAREAGNLLGVHQVMMGSLGKIFDKYVIDLRLYAVESGAVVKSMTTTYRGDVDGLIIEIEKLAWNMVDQTSRK